MSQVDRLPLSIKHFFSPRAFMGLAYLTGSQLAYMEMILSSKELI